MTHPQHEPFNPSGLPSHIASADFRRQAIVEDAAREQQLARAGAPRRRRSLQIATRLTAVFASVSELLHCLRAISRRTRVRSDAA
jgi:hypothetical protein